MTVGVVDRNKQHHDVLEQIRARLCDCNVAQQGQPSIFAVGLAGVNARLNQNYRLAARRACFRCKGFAFGGDQ